MPKNRRIKSVKTELVKKAREAMLAAVQLYNNPQVTFKAESFITLSVIGWTYLLHAYYRSIGVDYRYYRYAGKRKITIKQNTEHISTGNLNDALMKTIAHWTAIQ